MQPSPFISLLPLLLISVILGFVGHFLAKDKGRPVLKWTIVSFIPIINYICMVYLIGCTNLRLERKLDELLAAQKSRTDFQ
ncbi:hypothetical protein [Paraburkholderia sp. C35]|jgi:hypothetical protein|uniref:hypothetical protein n=1 Tax=Paraburkholderia sp. C35 TaxID=2126993 RepID=UPI000D68E5CE|nr:hypothetical protein [Paraburkholderia sp. C35]